MNYDLLWSALEKAKKGSIEIILPEDPNSKLNSNLISSSNGSSDLLNQGLRKKFVGSEDGPNAQIKIFDYEAINSLMSGGDVAFGEGYVNGIWDTENLPDLISYIAYNSTTLEDFFHARKLQAMILFLKSLLQKNSKRGSKKNISYHYDLGNDFYQLWLDKTMTYSSALFLEKNMSLEQAQIAKYQQILSKVSGKNILEIGCGWGGFAEIAGQEGYEVKCLTISKQQHEYANNRLKAFSDKISVVLQDYRDEKGIYDNVVSIEMFEAVGQKYWQKYFEVLNRVLKQNGKAVLQIITIDEKVFVDYKKRVDFIQKHIFPGGSLPAKSTIRELAERSGFVIKSELNFADDYAKTLKIWLDNFDAKKEQILKLNFSQEFIRKWRFYLSYCIAGFVSKRTDVVQFELQKI